MNTTTATTAEAFITARNEAARLGNGYPVGQDAIDYAAARDLFYELEDAAEVEEFKVMGGRDAFSNEYEAQKLTFEDGSQAFTVRENPRASWPSETRVYASEDELLRDYTIAESQTLEDVLEMVDADHLDRGSHNLLFTARGWSDDDVNEMEGFAGISVRDAITDVVESMELSNEEVLKVATSEQDDGSVLVTIHYTTIISD